MVAEGRQGVPHPRPLSPRGEGRGGGDGWGVYGMFGSVWRGSGGSIWLRGGRRGRWLRGGRCGGWLADGWRRGNRGGGVSGDGRWRGRGGWGGAGCKFRRGCGQAGCGRARYGRGGLVIGGGGALDDGEADVGGRLAVTVVEALEAGDLTLGGEGDGEVAGAVVGAAWGLGFFEDGFAGAGVGGGIKVGEVVGAESAGAAGVTRGLDDATTAGAVELAGEDGALDAALGFVGVPGGDEDGAVGFDGAVERFGQLGLALGGHVFAEAGEPVTDGARGHAEGEGDLAGAHAAGGHDDGALLKGGGGVGEDVEGGEGVGQVVGLLAGGEDGVAAGMGDSGKSGSGDGGHVGDSCSMGGRRGKRPAIKIAPGWPAAATSGQAGLAFGNDGRGKKRTAPSAPGLREGDGAAFRADRLGCRAARASFLGWRREGMRGEAGLGWVMGDGGWRWSRELAVETAPGGPAAARSAGYGERKAGG